MKILSKNNKKGFIDVNNIDKLDCDWNMIIGERSNGKTYGVLCKVLDDYIKTDRPSVLIRRKEETIRPANIGKLFESHETNGYLKKLGCDAIVYSRRAFYCAYEEKEGKFKKADKPFMYCTSINTSETTKGTFPTVNTKNIVFDEFLTRESYLPNEYTRLMNLISTVKREVTDCKIWMLANTVSWSSPYFREFGLNNINKQEKGTINIYDYTDGENTTSLAVEYCTTSTNKSKKASDRYFAFGSPQLRMIKNGSWEVNNYNHMLSDNYQDSTLISRNFYMTNDLDTVCLELRKSPLLGRFIFVRPQTHPIDMDRAVVVYTTNTIDTRKHHTVLTKSKVDNLIIGLYNKDRFYYADNTCGETVRNVLQTMNIRFRELHT